MLSRMVDAGGPARQVGCRGPAQFSIGARDTSDARGAHRRVAREARDDGRRRGSEEERWTRAHSAMHGLVDSAIGWDASPSNGGITGHGCARGTADPCVVERGDTDFGTAEASPFTNVPKGGRITCSCP